MGVRVANIFLVPGAAGEPPVDGQEIFERLAEGPGLRVERIVSWGQKTPAGQWYEQAEDEWVALVQGSAALVVEEPGAGGEVVARELALVAGDAVLLPAGLRHRVERTSGDPPCIWLAVHGRLGAP